MMSPVKDLMKIADGDWGYGATNRATIVAREAAQYVKALEGVLSSYSQSWFEDASKHCATEIKLQRAEHQLAELDRKLTAGIWLSNEEYAKECQQALDLKTQLQDALMQIEELQQEIQGLAYVRGCI
jgi:predicted RNase H-like nuclease (RuvC/YqgF family)